MFRGDTGNLKRCQRLCLKRCKSWPAVEKAVKRMEACRYQYIGSRSKLNFKAIEFRHAVVLAAKWRPARSPLWKV